jgi:FtsZ-binding cell division protein ZapB
MEEIEVPLEAAHEEIHHNAHEAPMKSWIMGVALSSSLLAVMAAIAALMAGHDVNEAMINQIQASDKWAYFQAKGIKSSLIEARLDLATNLDEKKIESLKEKMSEYKKEQSEIKAEADKLEVESHHNLHRHEYWAGAVTFFQIAIALSAISIVVRKKIIWKVSLAIGSVGLCSLMYALFTLFKAI